MSDTSLQPSSGGALAARQTLEPTTLKEAWEFSEIVANSELAPKDYRGKPANVLVCVQFGKELGIPPMQALQGIAVINGRPTVWGDLMWALVTSHPAFEDAKEEATDTQATVTLKRRGRSAVTVTFSKADAEKAGLWGKAGPWTQYPKRQMLWRARTFAARDLFPDALKGMVSAEEAMDYSGMTIDASTASPQQLAGEMNKGRQQEPADPPIGHDKAKEWYEAYKANGWKPADARAWLDKELGIKSSADIPTSHFEKAMKWAKTMNPAAIRDEDK